MSEMDHRLGSRYLLKERLGRGAMGTVWRATNTDTKSDVAVKVLSEELSDEPEMVARFIQERNALIAVHHPNLVRIHDLVVEDGRLAIVMDLIPGPDLHRHLVERGVLGLTEAAVIGRGVAGALAAIHAAGIIHRDLKPANILLDLSGPAPEPKLVDFGIARMLTGSRLTARSSVVGTPQYLSPEAISGAEPTPAVDVYAFGIALYELFTGNPPFHGEQLLQVLNQHMYQEPSWPPSIPPQILPLLQAMLAKDPQARPTAPDIAQSMEALVAAGPYPAAAAPGTPLPAQQGPAAAPVPGTPISPLPGQPGPAAPVPGTPISPLPGQPGPAAPVPGTPVSPLPAPQQASPYQSDPMPAPYGRPQQTPYPGDPMPAPYGRPQQTPYPGAPMPAPYGRPQQTPIPAPSPSGFFYPNAAMIDPSLAGTSENPSAPFTPSPPPFTDEMFAPKKRKSRKKPLIAVGAVLGVAAVGGIVFALTSGGGSPKPPVALGTTAAATSVPTTPTATISPSCPPQSTPTAAAQWMLDGTPLACASGTGALHLFGGATWGSSSRGAVLKLNGTTSRATIPLGSIVNTAHSFSVSAWVDLDSQPKSSKTVVAFEGQKLDAFELQYDASTKSWAFSRSSVDSADAQWTAADSTKPALVHAWTHLVGVYDSANHTLELYVNGTPVATRSGISGWQATVKITVGASLDPTGNPFQNLSGEISQVEVFNSALTTPQVDALK